MLVGVDQEDAMVAAASSGCSSGCQSGWTTYLDDDHSSYSCGTARFHGKAQQPCYGCDDYSEEAEEEDDLSMISDASSGPRQQYSAGSDEGAAAHANAPVERGGRRVEPAARRQSKMTAVASLLEDTASSPAFFKYSKVMSSPEANGYSGAAAPAMEIGNGNAADFSCAFSAMTGFESPLNGSPLGRYLQVQYSPAPVKPMPTRQEVCRDGGDKIKRYW